MPLRPPAGFISANYDPLKVPNAPTIGTATGGDAQASVAFTAPSNTGGSAITAYYAVSNPSQITASGASSPVTVTGLTNGTAYTFKVWALNSYGPSPYSAASGSVTPANPYYIGTIKPASNDYYFQGRQSHIASDSTSLYVVGNASATNDGAVQKLTGTSITFQKRLSVSGVNSYFEAVAVDSSGNLYIGGYYAGPTTGSHVVKLDSSGSITWARFLQSSQYNVSSIALDSSLNVYVLGAKNTGSSFGSSNRFVIMKLSSTGTTSWHFDYGSTEQSYIPWAVAYNSTTSAVISVGRRTPDAPPEAIILSQAASNGAVSFEKVYGSNTRFTGVAVGSTGNIYVTGQSANSRSLILKLDSSGNKTWGNQLATSSPAPAVALDSSENVYIATRSNNSYSCCVAKYNSSGTIQWQRNISIPSTYEFSSGVSISVSGNNIAIAAQISGPAPSYYVFTATLNTDGSDSGTFSLGGLDYTIAASSFTTATDGSSFSDISITLSSQSRTNESISPTNTTTSYTFTTTSI